MPSSRIPHTPKTSTLHCADCGFPYAVVRDGELIIKSMHRRGKMHTNRIRIEDLAKMCGKPEPETASE